MRTAMVLGVVALATGLTACSGGGGGAAVVPGCTRIQPAGFPIVPEGATVGATAGDIALKDMNDNDVCLRDFSGKVVLLNTGAGWCPPCRAETPDIQSVYAEKKGEGFEVVMAMFEDYDGGNPDPAFIADWIQTYSVTFKVLPDPGSEVYGTYGQGYVPHNVVIDRDQVIRSSTYGSFASPNAVKNAIQPYLDTPATLVYE